MKLRAQKNEDEQDQSVIIILRASEREKREKRKVVCNTARKRTQLDFTPL